MPHEKNAGQRRAKSAYRGETSGFRSSDIESYLSGTNALIYSSMWSLLRMIGTVAFLAEGVRLRSKIP